MMFCFKSILQIWIMLIGFRDTNDFVNLAIADLPYTSLNEINKIDLTGLSSPKVSGTLTLPSTLRFK